VVERGVETENIERQIEERDVRVAWDGQRDESKRERWSEQGKGRGREIEWRGEGRKDTMPESRDSLLKGKDQYGWPPCTD
jgi:hypothetical protein